MTLKLVFAKFNTSWIVLCKSQTARLQFIKAKLSLAVNRFICKLGQQNEHMGLKVTLFMDICSQYNLLYLDTSVT